MDLCYAVRWLATNLSRWYDQLDDHLTFDWLSKYRRLPQTNSHGTSMPDFDLDVRLPALSWTVRMVDSRRDREH